MYWQYYSTVSEKLTMTLIVALLKVKALKENNCQSRIYAQWKYSYSNSEKMPSGEKKLREFALRRIILKVKKIFLKAKNYLREKHRNTERN